MKENAAPLVYVTTLNCNGSEDTLTFLESYTHLTYPRKRMLVVDNASDPESLIPLQQQFPHTDWVINPLNLGFAGGVNVALRYAFRQQADYVFVANNDTQLAADLLEQLVEAAQHYEADIASPMIYYAHAPERVWRSGGRRSRLTLEIANCTAPDLTPIKVDYVTACGMLLRRASVESVGEFDERFFMYYEDSDYCLRARDLGFTLLLVPQAKMWHKVATTIGGIDSPDERYHMALSSVRFFKKHVRGWRWLIVAPYRLASALKTTLRLFGRGQRAAAQAYWHGLWDGLRT